MNDKALTYDDILLVPEYNDIGSRKNVSTSIQDVTGKLKLDIPIITSNMDTITGSTMANYIASKGGIGVLHRNWSIEDNVKAFKECNNKVFVSIGINDVERFQALLGAGAKYFCVDVAHAHCEAILDILDHINKYKIYHKLTIMCGNVATGDGARFLYNHDVDIIKVGIGGGSACTTRIKTGFGIPMISCIEDCVKAIGGLASIVADGGIKTSGDMVKALAVGADFIMIGGMLAGTDPTPGIVIDQYDGSKVKTFRGMASSEAQNGFLPAWKTAEGVSTTVSYRTDQDAIIGDLVGGLRSGLTYGGANNIKILQQKCNYYEITNNTIKRNGSHI